MTFSGFNNSKELARSRVRLPTFSIRWTDGGVGANISKGLRSGASVMNFSQSKDERLLAFYENVRRQVEFDRRSGAKYRFAGEGVKQYAEKLREEMDRRRLQFTPIDWHS